MASISSIEEILDSQTIALLQGVTKGSCALLDPEDRAERQIGATVPLPGEDVERIRQWLLDVNSWFFAFKRCLPKRTALFRLQSPAGETQLRVGMSCYDWHLTGRPFMGFFDPVAGEMRSLLKRTFPALASPRSHSLWRRGAIRELLQQEADRGH